MALESCLGDTLVLTWKLQSKKAEWLDTQEDHRKGAPWGSQEIYLWQRLWPERGQVHLLRGHQARGCAGIEDADKNKEKEVTYGNGGSEPNGM